MGRLVLLCYVLGVPGIALAVCLACRRHRVLLWLGGGLVVAVGTLLVLLALSMRDQGSEAVFAWGAAVYASVPLVAAGIVLLVGGLVRWGSSPRPGPRATGPPRRLSRRARDL